MNDIFEMLKSVDMTMFHEFTGVSEDSPHRVIPLSLATFKLLTEETVECFSDGSLSRNILCLEDHTAQNRVPHKCV